MNTSSASSRSLRAAAALLCLATAASSASADLYWNQPLYTGDAATAANWNNAADGSGSTAAPDTTNPVDDLFFNATAHNAIGGDISVAANFAARSLTFNTTGATRLVQSGSPILRIGEGGITLGATSGAVTLGTGNFLNTRVAASQTWTNNSAATLTVRSLASNTGSGAVTLTTSAVGTGGILFSQNIGDTVSDPLAIVIDSAGSGLTTINGTANTYRGGTTIKRGSLSAFGTLGSGAVLLGDTTGNSAATLNVRSAPASPFTNNITVRGGSSGAKTLTTNQTGGVVLNGALTLDDSLTVTTFTDGTFNGGISGVGGIVKGGNGALTFAGANTSSGDLTINSGAFTLAQAGSLTFHIDATGEANQVNGSTLGAITFNGTFNLDLSEAMLSGDDSWTLVSFAATAIYGENFSLTGFSQSDNIWTNSSGFSFAESTGVLSYSAVPEPASFALLAGLGTLALASVRRRKLRA